MKLFGSTGTSPFGEAKKRYPFQGAARKGRHSVTTNSGKEDNSLTSPYRC